MQDKIKMDATMKLKPMGKKMKKRAQESASKLAWNWHQARKQDLLLAEINTITLRKFQWQIY